MKKILSLVLAVVLAFGMAAVGFAADTTKDIDITVGASGQAVVNVTSTWSGDFTGKNDYSFVYDSVSDARVDWDNIRSDTEVALAYINKTSSTGAIVNTSTSDLSRAKVTVKKRVSKGGELLDAVEFKNVNHPYLYVAADGTLTTTSTGNTRLKTVEVRITFIDPFVSIKEKEFDITVYLALDGTRTSTEWGCAGYMENETVEVDEDDEVYLGDGYVADCKGYTKAIKVDAGNGLFINTKMFDGKKYYAMAVQEPTAADDEILAKYPEIDTIYTLYKINMDSAGNTVEFDIDDKFYVYNADGKYIGMTSDKLPISSKYYLATKKIDMEGVVDEDTDAPVDVDSPETGGDDVPVNANDNPGTGANGFVNVAVVAGLVALAAAGAVSKK